MKHYDCGTFGDHKNQITIMTPKEWGHTREFFSVDPCIASEIVFLIVNGVETLASCCGHGKGDPNVSVSEASVQKMLELGYVRDKRYDERFNAFVLWGD